jgi:hypothetical protein
MSRLEFHNLSFFSDIPFDYSSDGKLSSSADHLGFQDKDSVRPKGPPPPKRLGATVVSTELGRQLHRETERTEGLCRFKIQNAQIRLLFPTEPQRKLRVRLHKERGPTWNSPYGDSLDGQWFDLS